MSYMSVQSVLTELLACQRLFCRWAKKQKGESIGPGSEMLLNKIVQDACTREEALREAIEKAPKDALTTQLQYESVGDVRSAVDRLPETMSDEPAEIMEPVAEYYTALTDTLRQAARQTSVPAAEELFTRLTEETAAVIASEAWAAREE